MNSFCEITKFTIDQLFKIESEAEFLFILHVVESAIDNNSEVSIFYDDDLMSLLDMELKEFNHVRDLLRDKGLLFYRCSKEELDKFEYRAILSKGLWVV